jgi:hypothetical protein
MQSVLWNRGLRSRNCRRKSSGWAGASPGLRAPGATFRPMEGDSLAPSRPSCCPLSRSLGGVLGLAPARSGPVRVHSPSRDDRVSAGWRGESAGRRAHVEHGTDWPRTGGKGPAIATHLKSWTQRRDGKPPHLEGRVGCGERRHPRARTHSCGATWGGRPSVQLVGSPG